MCFLVNAFSEAALAAYPELLEQTRERARRRQAGPEQQQTLAAQEQEGANGEEVVEVERPSSPCPYLEEIRFDYNYIGMYCRQWGQ